MWNRRLPTEVVALQLRITPVTEVHILTQTEQEVEWLVTRHALDAVVIYSPREGVGYVKTQLSCILLYYADDDLF